MLRQLVQDSTKPDAKELFSGLDLTFCIQLSQEEGGGSKELIKNGKQVPVTPDNIRNYVKRYAEYRMVIAVEKPLEVRDFNFSGNTTLVYKLEAVFQCAMLK